MRRSRDRGRGESVSERGGDDGFEHLDSCDKLLLYVSSSNVGEVLHGCVHSLAVITRRLYGLVTRDFQG